MVDNIAVPEVKSGLKTTELWLKMVVLGGLVWLVTTLNSDLPTLLATPGIPPWVGMLVPFAKMGIAALMAKLSLAYTQSRTDLKLGSTQVSTPEQADAVVKDLIAGAK